MANGLLERLRRYSGQVPKPDAPAQVAVSQLLQEKAVREAPIDTAPDLSGITREIPNGDIAELIHKAQTSQPIATSRQKLQAAERTNKPQNG